jgi:hypothetical protein
VVDGELLIKTIGCGIDDVNDVKLIAAKMCLFISFKVKE